MKKANLLFLLLTSAILAFNQNYNSQELIKKGIALYDEEKYTEAIQAYKQVHLADTSYVYMQSELAMTYLQAKDYDLAIKTCNDALLDVSPYENHLMRTLATAYDEKGDPEQAVNIYLKALSKYPFDYLLLYNLGITYYGVHNYPKATEYFQKALKSNPFHTSSHLMLGKISAAQGQLSHAILSIETFLLLEPSSNRSNQALICLENLSNNYIDTAYVGNRIEPFLPNNLFEDLDHYLRAKIVLNERFESAIDFNASLVKQTQLILDKFPYQAKERDFWLEFYMPFYNNTNDKGFVKEFLNTILRSAKRESINKWANKNEKSLKEFYATGTYLGQYKTYLYVEDSVRITCKHYDSGSIASIGNFNEVENEEGDWTFYYENGHKQASGKFINGKKEGPWEYYNMDGFLETTCTYADGNLNGIYSDFDAYGNQKTAISYVNGELEGDVKFLFPCKIVQEYNHYSKSKIDGFGYTLFSTGDTLSTFTYKDSKLEGEYKRYHPNGNLNYKTNLINGENEGDYIEFFEDRTISVTGEYVHGKEDGKWQYFHANGKLKIDMSYKDGIKIGIWKEYDSAGELLKQYEFNEEGHLTNDFVFYKKTKPQIIETYKDDILVAVTSLNSAGDTIKQVGSEDGTFEFETFSLDGLLNTKGKLVNGNYEGAKTLYWRNGGVQEVSNYINGVLNGEVINYFENGKIQTKRNFENGKESGSYFEYYQNGSVKTTGNYKNGELDGLWLNYYVDGTLEQEFSYKHGEVFGWMYNYSVDGKLAGKTKLENGSAVIICQYDSIGNLFHTQNLLTAPKRVFMNYNKSAEGDCDMSCGKLNGDLVWYYPDRSKYIVNKYKDDNPEGTFTSYHPNGKVQTTGEYKNTSRNGEWKEFYEDGTIRKIYHYEDDQLDSTYTNYWENGKIKSRSIYKNDKKDGDSFTYDPQGNLAIKRIYIEGEIFAYQYNKNGSLCDSIYLENGTGKILAYYNTGEISTEANYKLGLFDGKYIRYSKSGKKISVMQFADGIQIGEEEEYFENGKLKSKMYYENDLKVGEGQVYNINGNLKYSKMYKMGVLQGESKNYNEEGKLKSIEEYWNGKLSNYITL